MWIISVVTAGAMSPVAATLTAISLGIGYATIILDAINALVLKKLIMMYRALHAFTSEADPRDVVTQGHAISQASGAAMGFVGGFAGGVAGGALAEKGVKIAKGKPPTPVPDHPTPPAASGEGPTVKAQPTAEGKPVAQPSPEPQGETKTPSTAAPETKLLPEGSGLDKGTATQPGTSVTPSGETGKPPSAAPSSKPLPEDGHIVWSAMEQLGEKFDMGAGVAPKKRINFQKKAATRKANFEKGMRAAGFSPKEAGKEVSNVQWEPVEGKANPKKAQTARARYARELAELHDERTKAQREAMKGFWKGEGEKGPIESEEALDKRLAGWVDPHAGVGPLTPTKPDVVRPLKEPPRVTEPRTGKAQAGLLGRHEHQPPRGAALISEHVMPGAQWAAIMEGKKGSIYSSRQYGLDFTMLFGKEEAGIKTHEGPTADNARTRALKAKAARGERIDIVADILLPSIEETIRARNIAEQRRAPHGQPTWLSYLPAASRAGEREGERGQEPGLRRNLDEFAHLDVRSMNTTEKVLYAAEVVGGGAAVTALRDFEQAVREPVIEHVNPNYPVPPCMPNDIVAIQNQIRQILDSAQKSKPHPRPWSDSKRITRRMRHRWITCRSAQMRRSAQPRRISRLSAPHRGQQTEAGKREERKQCDLGLFESSFRTHHPDATHACFCQVRVSRLFPAELVAAIDCGHDAGFRRDPCRRCSQEWQAQPDQDAYRYAEVPQPTRQYGHDDERTEGGPRPAGREDSGGCLDPQTDRGESQGVRSRPEPGQAGHPRPGLSEQGSPRSGDQIACGGRSDRCVARRAGRAKTGSGPEPSRSPRCMGSTT